MSAEEYILLIVFANSYKTFLTIIPCVDFGRYLFKWSVVIQALPLVFSAWDLYLIESKNVKSFFLAKFNGLIFSTLNFIRFFNLGKIEFIVKFFFLKKKICLH